MRLLFLTSVLSLLLFKPIYSQNRNPVDTVESNGSQIVIFDDKSWNFLHPEIIQAGTDSVLQLLKDLPVFSNNWITQDKYAYLETRHEVFPEINLDLIVGEDRFVWPVNGPLYGKFRKGHKGIDIGVKTGDTIKSVFGGRVRLAQYDRSGYGKLVIVRHYNGLETFYAHLSKISVEPGQWVEAGETIGLGGSTGRSKGPHLHFEFRYFDRPIDPLRVFSYENKQLLSEELTLSKDIYYGNWATATKPVATTGQVLGGGGDSDYHVIRKGDNLGSIARKYGTTVKQIQALNNMGNSTFIKAGKTLRIR